MQISPGKLWCLRRLSDDTGFFKMTAVDQRPGVEALVRQRRATAQPAWEDVGEIKRVLVEGLVEGLDVAGAATLAAAALKCARPSGRRGVPSRADVNQLLAQARP